jgi:hypothetical protein
MMQILRLAFAQLRLFRMRKTFDAMPFILAVAAFGKASPNVSLTSPTPIIC